MIPTRHNDKSHVSRIHQNTQAASRTRVDVRAELGSRMPCRRTVVVRWEGQCMVASRVYVASRIAAAVSAALQSGAP